MPGVIYNDERCSYLASLHTSSSTCPMMIVMEMCHLFWSTWAPAWLVLNTCLYWNNSHHFGLVIEIKWRYYLLPDSGVDTTCNWSTAGDWLTYFFLHVPCSSPSLALPHSSLPLISQLPLSPLPQVWLAHFRLHLVPQLESEFWLD